MTTQQQGMEQSGQQKTAIVLSCLAIVVLFIGAAALMFFALGKLAEGRKAARLRAKEEEEKTEVEAPVAKPRTKLGGREDLQLEALKRAQKALAESRKETLRKAEAMLREHKIEPVELTQERKPKVRAVQPPSVPGAASSTQKSAEAPDYSGWGPFTVEKISVMPPVAGETVEAEGPVSDREKWKAPLRRFRNHRPYAFNYTFKTRVRTGGIMECTGKYVESETGLWRQEAKCARAYGKLPKDPRPSHGFVLMDGKCLWAVVYWSDRTSSISRYRLRKETEWDNPLPLIDRRRIADQFLSATPEEAKHHGATVNFNDTRYICLRRDSVCVLRWPVKSSGDPYQLNLTVLKEETNPSIPKGTFEYKPPKGVEVTEHK